jgi:ferredoxin--NADP+ reductase
MLVGWLADTALKQNYFGSVTGMQWTSGIVERRQVWTEGLFTLSIRTPDVEPFEPGQFLQLGLPNQDTDGATHHLHRPYSVASPHGELLDFFIVLVADGRLSPQLWDLHEGDSVDVSTKGAGSFTLAKSPDASTLWLIATGTGVAPYIAMLRTDEPWRRYQRIVLVHGVRHLRDLAYTEEMTKYTELKPEQFSYVPVVSRESGDGVLSGRITQVAEDGSLESMAGSQFSADDSCVLLCGNPLMLDDMEALLITRGLEKHRSKTPGNIVAERYW